jgi:8-oxo-dGTP pyrophosphatase MutT (NUDIX family)
LSESNPQQDLRAKILRRFAGTQPGHEPADWRMLGVNAEHGSRLARYLPANPVPAAVLVPLIDRPEGMTVLLTQRASQLARHAAQIAFPGGRIDAGDADAASAALREAREEIGLDSGRVEVFGYLPDHAVISGYRVTPVLGLVAPPFSLQLNPAEVAGVFEVPLPHVLDSANHKARLRRVGDEELLLYDIPWQGQNIWGATAGMLLTFVKMLQQEPLS